MIMKLPWRSLGALLLVVTLCAVQPLPAARAASCGAGRVVDAVAYSVPLKIYLPPCYDATAQAYPVLYLLHGRHNDSYQWLSLGLTQTADELMSNQIAPFIIVLPYDRMNKSFDAALVREVVPFVDANFRTLPSRAHRAIGGVSHGGGWALHIGLAYPQLFSRIGAHSPDLFVGDDVNILGWANQLDLPMQIAIDIGDDDSMIYCCASAYDQLLTRAGVAHTYTVQPGAHVAAYWAAHLADYLTFYAQGW